MNDNALVEAGQYPDPESDEQDQVRGELLHLRNNVWHMTQDELAQRLGVSRQTIANWEHGEKLQFPQLVRAGLREVSSAMTSAPVLFTGTVASLPQSTTIPVPDRLRECIGYLREAHTLMDRLESIGQAGEPLQPIGLPGMATMAAQLAMELMNRMHAMFGEEPPSMASGTSASSVTLTYSHGRPNGYN
jgi:transcriptional regulator with XRE-family HTH domain